MSTPEWSDLNHDHMPTIIVDIDHDVVHATPPWSASSSSTTTNHPSSSSPRPPPIGFSTNVQENINRDIHRLVPSSPSHPDGAHYHDTTSRASYRSPFTGHRYEFNPKRNGTMHVEVDNQSVVREVKKKSEEGGGEGGEGEEGEGGEGATLLVSPVFVQGCRREMTVLCGGSHQRWMDEVRVSFLCGISSILIGKKFDVRNHVERQDIGGNAATVFSSFDSDIFLKKMTDLTCKPMARKIFATQMFAQFLSSLSSTAPSNHHQKQDRRRFERAHTSDGGLHRAQTSDSGLHSGRGRGRKEDEAEEEESHHHVDLWSILEIATEINKRRREEAAQAKKSTQQQQQQQQQQRQRATSRPPPPRPPRPPRPPPRPPPRLLVPRPIPPRPRLPLPRTPKGAPPVSSVSSTYGPLPATPPEPPPITVAAQPRPPPPPRPPPQQTKKKISSAEETEETEETDQTDQTDQTEESRVKDEKESISCLLGRLCRAGDEKVDPIFQFHQQKMEEEKNKNENGGGVMPLLRVPSSPLVLLSDEEMSAFDVHTCLWGHYQIRSLSLSLYEDVKSLEDTETGERTMTKQKMTGVEGHDDDDDDEEGDDTFVELQSPSSSTPLRTKRSFKQKTPARGATPLRKKGRRHSTFAAVGTNDLSYLGVTADRFAEIQSSIWSRVLPTMGKISSKINKRGRRVSMIGGQGAPSPSGSGGGGGGGGGMFHLQRMMAQHAVGETVVTPSKQLVRGGSVHQLVGNKTTPKHIFLRGSAIRGGGSGGRPGKYGMTPAKSTTKRVQLGKHRHAQSTMSALDWSTASVSPSMDAMLTKRKYAMALERTKIIGKDIIEMKRKMVVLEEKMRLSVAETMIRRYQVRKLTGPSYQPQVGGGGGEKKMVVEEGKEEGEGEEEVEEYRG